jgi:hypothetical protein
MIVKEFELDTDQFGTFSGEVERKGSALETAIKKARAGMHQSSSPLGMATEGSFGAHPLIPFIAGSEETIVLVDDELGFHVSETLISTNTNFGHCVTKSLGETEEFLQRAKFPSHGLLVKPNLTDQNLFQKIGRFFRSSSDGTTLKDIKDRTALELAIESCGSVSKDRMARVETDMRAHMNPTRMRVLRELGIKLARRLRSRCTECGCPGFGRTGVSGFLECSECGSASESPSHEVHSCPKCQFSKTKIRSDGLQRLDPMYCQRCNP